VVGVEFPAWPIDAAELFVQGRTHELTELRPSQLLQLVSNEHPIGIPPRPRPGGGLSPLQEAVASVSLVAEDR
jgi:hypothetical protein